MYATNDTEQKFLNTMKGVTWVAPANVYVGLYITNPGEEGTGVELSYDGYERQVINFSPAAEEDGVISIKNLSQITFPQAGIDAGTVTHIGISDSKIGGNMLAYGKSIEGLDIKEGEAPVLMAEEIVIYSTGDLSKVYKRKFLNVFRGESIAGITPHLALYNGNPESGGAELLGANYERVPIEFSSVEETSSGQTIIKNSEEVRFNRPTDDWGLWNWVAVMDAKSQGEPIWVYNRGVSKELKKGYMPYAEIAALRFAVN